MLVIGIRTRIKRKYRIDASSGLYSQRTKPKLRLTQLKFYSGAKEWRNGNVVHVSSCPCGKRDLILKSKDKCRRSEASDGGHMH